MYKIQSNSLNVIVNIQYAIGFELVEGMVEIEVSIFNQTQRSRTVDGGRNRLNFHEQFVWNIDKANLKYCLSINEIAKIECFTTPDITYGHIYRKQRIGHVIIKLKEFQILGRVWDQNICVRGYKIQGCSGHYEIRILSIIQEDVVSDISRKINDNNYSRLNSSVSNVKNVKQSITDKKQDSMNKDQQIIIPKNKEKRNLNNEGNINNGNSIDKWNIYNENNNKQQSSKVKDNKMNKTNKPKNQMNEKNEKNIKNLGNSLDKQDFQKTMNKYGVLINDSNIKNNIQNITPKREKENELINMTKKFENLEFFKASDDCRLNEMLTNGLKCTEEFSQIMKKMKTELCNNIVKRHSSNSSIQTDGDLEQLAILAYEIMKRIFKFIEIFKKYGMTNKSKISQDITRLKDTACILSEFCENLAKYIETLSEV